MQVKVNYKIVLVSITATASQIFFGIPLSPCPKGQTEWYFWKLNEMVTSLLFFCPSKPSPNLETNPCSSQKPFGPAPLPLSPHFSPLLIDTCSVLRVSWALSWFRVFSYSVPLIESYPPNLLLARAMWSHFHRNILPDYPGLIWSLELFSLSSSSFELILIHDDAFPFC